MGNESKNIYVWAKYGNLALSFGFTLVFAVGGGALLGNWLDGRVHTSPLFLIVGIMLGVAVSFISLWEIIKGLEQTDFMEHENVDPVYKRALHLRQLYFRKARVPRGQNPSKRKE